MLQLVEEVKRGISGQMYWKARCTCTQRIAGTGYLWVRWAAGRLTLRVSAAGAGVYVQVSVSMMNEKTRERELGSLQLVRDSYPKYLVALNDMHLGSDFEGIACINLREFLAMEQ